MKVTELARNLQPGRHGIWTAPATGAVSYQEDGHAQFMRLEDDSFWFSHRNECIVSIMKRFPPSGPILDIGGGNGYVTRRLLEEGFDAALIEPGPAGATNARLLRQIPNVICARLEDLDFLPGAVGAAGLFDVIEHAQDDRGLIGHVRNAMPSGALLYATVPAHQFLWSRSDIAAGHFRRYDRRAIRDLLGDRFELLFFSYIFGVLTLPVLLVRALPFRAGFRRGNVLSPASEHGTGGGFLVGLLRVLLKRELNTLKRGSAIGVGTSCLFVARAVAEVR